MKKEQGKSQADLYAGRGRLVSVVVSHHDSAFVSYSSRTQRELTDGAGACHPQGDAG